MQKQVYEFISTKTSDPIVERKTCKVSGQSFAIFQSDVEMLDKLSPVIGGQKIALPLPTLCPEERNTRRISFRNDSKIYRRTCDFTGKPFISMYSPEKPYKVYHNDIWYSDKRDAIQFGRDFDFTQDFFPQFTGLLLEVPRLGLQVRNSENCDYCGVASHAKNCYLSNVCSWSEDVHYSSWVTHSKSCMDCFRCYKIENSYQCIFCNSSLKLNYCILVNNSFDCLRSINLDNCENCFLCHNLNNKKYCIRNTQYTKEEYMEYIRKIDRCDAHWFQTTEAEFTKMRQEKTIYRATCNTNTPDSYGAFLTDSKNCKICFDIVTGEDCSYFFDAGSDEKSCMDCSYGGDIEKSYESLSSGTKGYHNLFCTFSWDGTNLIYCDACMGCSDCFGCIGLQHKQYCILNKQYTKEEYEKLVPQIITHMQTIPAKNGSGTERGEFFPSSISPFGYNETVAMEYISLTKEEALTKEYKRMDKEYFVNIPDNYEKIVANNLPYNIDEISDDIINKVILCEASAKPFRIIKSELDFYRNHHLPLPRRHPDQRHLERVQKRPERELYLRNCDHCKEENISIYPQDTTFKVYCEECYSREIYG